jgi:RimJ/RimL family protein N-acetyltransferase
MASPVVSAERVRLVPFAEQHLTPEYVSWLNDRELLRHSEQRHREHSLESCRAYWLGFSGTPHHFWAIEALDLGGLHVGNLNAYVDPHNALADMGILIGHRQARGRGYGHAAWQAGLAYLLGELRLRKITAGMLAENVGMMHIARTSGMVEDGLRRRHYLLDGRESDVVYWAHFAAQGGGGVLHG